MKKKYIKPYIKEVKLRSRFRILNASGDPPNAKKYNDEFAYAPTLGEDGKNHIA